VAFPLLLPIFVGLPTTINNASSSASSVDVFFLNIDCADADDSDFLNLLRDDFPNSEREVIDSSAGTELMGRTAATLVD